MRIPAFLPHKCPAKKVITKKTFLVRGCAGTPVSEGHQVNKAVVACLDTRALLASDHGKGGVPLTRNRKRRNLAYELRLGYPV